MKILIVSEVFYPEDFIINDLALEWVRMGHRVEVVTQYPSYPQSFVFEGYHNDGFSDELWNDITIHRYPFVEGYKDNKLKKISNYFSFVKGGKRVMDSLDGDYDCVFVSQTGPLTVAYPALYMKKKKGLPVNIWTYDIWPDAVYGYGIPKNFLTDFFLKRMITSVYNGCDRIFISSQRFAETISQYSEKPCIYAPNWLRPAEDVKSALSLQEGMFHFTFTGNVSRYQNLINTIRGFHKSQLPNAILNIVGDGSYLDEVKSVAEQLGAQNIVFHGRRPYAEMNDVLRQSDVLVLPLISNEGIQKTEPLKLQSYLYAGKPIYGVSI